MVLSGRPAATFPLLVVPVGDLAGEGEEGHRLLGVVLGTFDGLCAQPGRGLHDRPFLGGELARLEQNMVGNADLADVMERRRLGQRWPMRRD